ncbi:hypothetical protein vseg_004161 [Gypsophila vaccaria]
MASTTSSLSSADHGEISTISTVHRDIVECNILRRLDGLSITSLGCTSSYFNTISSEDSLWRQICTSTWPSVNHQRVQRLISNAPDGHRRLFSDCFPSLTPHDQSRNFVPPMIPSDLISAVDIWYQKKLIFSRVLETKTKSTEFLESPFRVDVIDPKDVLPATPVKMDQCNDDTWLSLGELEENLTLSWIIYDPNTKKSANFSSTRPVTSERHWIPGEFDVQYATVLGCEQDGYVECKIVVTCSGLEHGELRVSEACMRVQNIDGKYLNGKISISSLMNAIEFGKRTTSYENGGKKIHEEYLRRKKLRWEKRLLKERVFGIACSVGGVYVVMLLFFLIATCNFFI